jgi:urease accessory protein
MTEIPTSPTHQRASGAVRIAAKLRDGVSALDDLRQEGCLKARFPRPEHGMEAVLLNSSGGVAAGDRLRADIAVGAGASLRVTAQAAERFYRAAEGSGPAIVRNTVSVAASGSAEWLPQETILFDRASLSRTLDIDLAEDARFLGVEMLVFGRQAMGETVRSVALSDTIRLRRAGRLRWHDAIRFDGDPHEALARAATGRGARTLASLIYAAPDAEARLEGVRTALEGGEAGASAWDGLLVARLLAPDSATLRRRAIAALAVLREERPLPRVWGC